MKYWEDNLNQSVTLLTYHEGLSVLTFLEFLFVGGCCLQRLLDAELALTVEVELRVHVLLELSGNVCGQLIQIELQLLVAYIPAAHDLPDPFERVARQPADVLAQRLLLLGGHGVHDETRAAERLLLLGALGQVRLGGALGEGLAHSLRVLLGVDEARLLGHWVVGVVHQLVVEFLHLLSQLVDIGALGVEAVAVHEDLADVGVELRLRLVGALAEVALDGAEVHRLLDLVEVGRDA